MNSLLREIGALFEQLRHPLTLTCVAVVLVAGACACWLMWWKTSRTVQALHQLERSLTTTDTTGPAAAIWRAKVQQLPDGRSMLSERPEQVLLEWLQLNVLRLARFEAGAWITGLALFFTFFLIALVLASEVGPAIGGEAQGDMDKLADAVRTMGAKFVVSMVGIAMSIAHGFLRARCTRNLHSAVDEAAHRLREATVSVGDFQIECTAQQLQQTVAMREAIESLKSIDVSVKDIGAELAAQLKHTVTKDIVGGIGDRLDEIVDGLEKSLTESFSTSLNTQVSLIADELRKIQVAVSGQAHSQVEDLLTKLGDLVSGGFASESTRMKDVLAKFAEVIPGLEAQMRTMSRTASEDLAQRTAEASRANAELFDRLGVVLEGMERQQREVAQASTQMQQFVMQAQSTLAGSLATANEQFSSRSQDAMDQLTTAMRTATGNAAEVYRSLVNEVEAAAKTLHQARTDATTGTTQLREATQLLREPLQRMAELQAGLRDTVSVLASSVQQAKTAVDSGAAIVKSSTDSVSQHQRFVKDLTDRWPEMAKQYLDDSDRQFKAVASAWKDQAEKIGESVSRISETFAGSATDFTSAVEELGQHVGKLNGGSTARGRG